MTKLLDEAVEIARRLPSNDQDDIARAIMQLAGSDLANPIILSPDEREAIARSKAAAGRGEIATDEQVRAVACPRVRPDRGGRSPRRPLWR
jgi:hypothetical protein